MKTQLEAILEAALQYLLKREDFECESQARVGRVLRRREIPSEHWDQDWEQIKLGMRSRIWEWLLAEPHIAKEFIADAPLPERLLCKLWSFGLSALDELHPRRKMQQGTHQFKDGEDETLLRQANRGCDSCSRDYREDDGIAPDVVLIQDELREELRERVRDAFRVLDLRSQRILVGYFFEERSWKEIARQEEVTPSRITQLVQAAFAKLRLILAQA
jgi:RNA polymerase sigma factor (sigma-70 family)